MSTVFDKSVVDCYQRMAIAVKLTRKPKSILKWIVGDLQSTAAKRLVQQTIMWEEP